jgi:osmotically-inducible protein OsmY
MFNFFEKKDSQLAQDVMDEMRWDPSVSATQIAVSAKGGVVSLRGSVPHYYEKSTAVEAAQRVSGVRAVADELEVNLMGSYARSDEDIAQAALNALEWLYTVPKGLKVEVEKGWVTLKGETTWDFQRSAAKNAVSQLMGVVGVSNKITIKKASSIRSSDVKNSIEKALKRSAEDESRKISVSINGDRVTLTGNVHSLYETTEAGIAAWNAPGVMRVENNLKVG